MRDPGVALMLLVTNAAWFSLRGHCADVVSNSMELPCHMILMPPQNTTLRVHSLHDLLNLFRVPSDSKKLDLALITFAPASVTKIVRAY